jgi:hypothetical protein
MGLVCGLVGSSHGLLAACMHSAAAGGGKFYEQGGGWGWLQIARRSWIYEWLQINKHKRKRFHFCGPEFSLPYDGSWMRDFRFHENGGVAAIGRDKNGEDY